MKEIQGKSILVWVSARFELARVRVIRSLSGVDCTCKYFSEVFLLEWWTKVIHLRDGSTIKTAVYDTVVIRIVLLTHWLWTKHQSMDVRSLDWNCDKLSIPFIPAGHYWWSNFPLPIPQPKYNNHCTQWSATQPFFVSARPLRDDTKNGWVADYVLSTSHQISAPFERIFVSTMQIVYICWSTCLLMSPSYWFLFTGVVCLLAWLFAFQLLTYIVMYIRLWKA